MMVRWRRCERARPETMSDFAMLPTSPPEQKARPSPVRITARISSSTAIVWMWA